MLHFLGFKENLVPSNTKLLNINTTSNFMTRKKVHPVNFIQLLVLGIEFQANYWTEGLDKQKYNLAYLIHNNFCCYLVSGFWLKINQAFIVVFCFLDKYFSSLYHLYWIWLFRDARQMTNLCTASEKLVVRQLQSYGWLFSPIELGWVTLHSTP